MEGTWYYLQKKNFSRKVWLIPCSNGNIQTRYLKWLFFLFLKPLIVPDRSALQIFTVPDRLCELFMIERSMYDLLKNQKSSETIVKRSWMVRNFWTFRNDQERSGMKDGLNRSCCTWWTIWSVFKITSTLQKRIWLRLFKFMIPIWYS